MTKYYSSGAIVLCIAGREKNKQYLILKSDNNYAYLVDGKTRKVENPKKKNFKHLNLLRKSMNFNFDKITNADVIKILNDYIKSKDCK